MDTIRGACPAHLESKYDNRISEVLPFFFSYSEWGAFCLLVSVLLCVCSCLVHCVSYSSFSKLLTPKCWHYFHCQILYFCQVPFCICIANVFALSVYPLPIPWFHDLAWTWLMFKSFSTTDHSSGKALNSDDQDDLQSTMHVINMNQIYWIDCECSWLAVGAKLLSLQMCGQKEWKIRVWHIVHVIAHSQVQ